MARETGLFRETASVEGSITPSLTKDTIPGVFQPLQAAQRVILLWNDCSGISLLRSPKVHELKRAQEPRAFERSPQR